MPMARCKDCGRVLNQDGSCSSVLECRDADFHEDMSHCPKCGHRFNE